MLPSEKRIRFMDAIRAARKGRQDPQDSQQAVMVIDALGGGTLGRTARRFKRQASGQRLLGARPELGETLSDHARLARMPEGSLGRAYLSLAQETGITPGHLVQATLDARERQASLVDPDENFVRDRMRDSHDIWHVLTGFGTDLVGESCLLAFTFGQTRNPGVALLVAVTTVSLLLRGRFDLPGRVLRAYLLGRRAGWLPAVEWERKLSRPLEQVRVELGIAESAPYEPFTSVQLAAG